MTYTSSPQVNTYTTKRIPLVREKHVRPGFFTVRDEDYLNCYIDPVKTRIVDDKRMYVCKRPGTDQLTASVAAADVRGMFFWADRGKIIYAVTNDVYVYSVAAGTTVTLSNVLGTTSGEVGFCEYLYDTGTSVIVATDGTTLITISNTNVVTTCSDPDLPAPHAPSPVFLDGYLFLGKLNSSDIYNSDLNDPMAWTAGNFISAEIEGDWVVRIAKINNYLIAFGKNSIEYFWDAAVETGSPMQRNDSVMKPMGYYGGFAQMGKNIIFVGQSTQGQLEVYMMEDLKVTPISNELISRYLNNLSGTYSSIRGALISTAGKNFYVLSTGDFTFVGDIESKLWYRWAWKQLDNFPICAAVNVKAASTSFPVFAMSLPTPTSKLEYFDDNFYQDETTDFTMSLVTDPQDFDTLNRKVMHRLTIIADSPNTDANVLVQWSDDDYESFNTGVEVNLNQDLPCVYRLGVFRQRAIKLTFTENAHFRAQYLEVDLNRGTA